MYRGGMEAGAEWQPSGPSSTEERRQRLQHERGKEDMQDERRRFMDEHDEALFGLGIHVHEGYLKQNDQLLVKSTQDSLGKRLLRLFGWREGRGIGKARVVRNPSTRTSAVVGPHDVRIELQKRSIGDHRGVGIMPRAMDSRSLRDPREEQGRLFMDSRILAHARHGLGSKRTLLRDGLYSNEVVSSNDSASSDEEHRAIAREGNFAGLEQQQRCADGTPVLPGFILDQSPRPDGSAEFDTIIVPKSFRGKHKFSRFSAAPGQRAWSDHRPPVGEGSLSSRFVRQSAAFTAPQKVEEEQQPKPESVGDTRRQTVRWQPEPLLCKRFGIRQHEQQATASAAAKETIFANPVQETDDVYSLACAGRELLVHVFGNESPIPASSSDVSSLESSSISSDLDSSSGDRNRHGGSSSKARKKRRRKQGKKKVMKESKGKGKGKRKRKRSSRSKMKRMKQKKAKARKVLKV